MRRTPLAALVLAAALGGCAAPRHEVLTPVVAGGQRGVVFSIDGAGGFEATSESLRTVVREECLPLAVQVVDWTHGKWRIISDEIDYCHARCEGERLAAAVAGFRQTSPGAAVYVVAHSAGSQVALAAAETLPPCAIDRIILLAPAVSASYDLRPALRCTREGIDVFYSGRDYGYLGIGTALFGTADRRWLSPAAGRTGFCVEPCTPADQCLYARLHQHAWDPCLAWTGNKGGHYGAYQPEFLRAYVVPLLR